MSNVGGIDKVVRLILGIVLIAMVFTGPQTPWGWVGLILVATALFNFCPAYKLLGFSTKK